MKRLSRLTLLFALAFALFLSVPAFLTRPAGPTPGMLVGDWVDLLTPLVLIPLYWLLFKVREDALFSSGEILAFLLFVVLWVQGQGVHLAANSIGHLVSASGPAYDLIYFYDERLGHILWHVGIMGLSAVLALRQARHLFEGQQSTLIVEGLAGLVYGVAFAFASLEGQTALLGFPFAAGVVAILAVGAGGRLRSGPLLAFFFAGYLAASLVFAGWGLYCGGFPEPLKVIQAGGCR